VSDERGGPGKRCPAETLNGRQARCHWSWLVPLLLSLLGGGWALTAFAQMPLKAVASQVGAGKAVEPATVMRSAAEVKQSLAAVQRELAAVDGPEGRAAGAPGGTPLADLQQRIRMLRLTAFAYRQHLNALESLAEQQKNAADAAAKRQAGRGPEGKPPYSVLVADGLRAELQVSQLNLRSEEGRLRILLLQLENTRDNLAKAGERRRLAQEALEAALPEANAVAVWKRNLVGLEERAAGAFAAALAVQRQVVEANIADYRQVVEFRQRNIAEVERSLRFDAGDLERLKSDIDERRSQTIRAMELASNERERLADELAHAGERSGAAGKRVDDLLAALADARKAAAEAEATLARAEQPATLLGKVNPFRGRSARADLELKKASLASLEKQLAAARREVRQSEWAYQLAVERQRNAMEAVEALNVALVTLDMRRTFWELRHSVFAESAGEKLDQRKMFEESRRLLKVIDPTIEHLRNKIEVIVGQIAEQQNLQRLAADEGESAFRQGLVGVLGDRERLHLTTFSEVDDTRNLLLRWVADEEVRSGEQGTRTQLSDWLAAAVAGVQALWNFELVAVEDSMIVDGKKILGTRGITVSKVAEAILIVIFGYLLVAIVSGLVVRVAVRHGRMEETSARIARKWILAVTLVALMLLALDAVKIPLAAFAFLGGAIAIGAGFGMQTLLKNLISGVMLLLERPFKPRDIVEVGGIRGEVTDINVRSCTIRDANGIETLVPNSTFLEQNVTNWTLSSRQVRHVLNVGVAYGSPVRQVSDLLLEVAGRHKLVLAEPPPEVLFTDFADNALMFALNVWLEVGPGRRSGNLVLSDLRFMIDASFAEHGIEIPFPQRQVRLEASAPLAVRVVPEAV
jgi:potassium-dependent mechanosensitive channel